MNNDPLGFYILPIYLEQASTDYQLVVYQEQANKIIKEYSSKPANRENCQELKTYLNHTLALCTTRPDCNSRKALMSAIEEIIEVLQSGIDREENRYYTPPADKKPVRTFGTRLAEAVDRWHMWGYKNRKIVTDVNELEGYLRSLPDIATIDAMSFIGKYWDTVCDKFFPIPDNVSVAETEHWLDKVALTKLFQVLAYVQLTSNHLSTQRILNIYNETDEPEPASSGA